MTIRQRIRSLALAVLSVAFVLTCVEVRGQWPFQRPSANPVAVEVLDVGQGDSILIRSPEGKTVLIDAGPTKEGAVRVLKRMGIAHLDLVAISHHHNDHYGGMEEVVRELKPRYFLASASGTRPGPISGCSRRSRRKELRSFIQRRDPAGSSWARSS